MVLAPAPKICRPISRHQIAIEPAAAGYSPFRDFVHCRFADAGRRWVWLRSHGRHPQTFTTTDVSRCSKLRIHRLGLLDHLVGAGTGVEAFAFTFGRSAAQRLRANTDREF